MSDQPTRVLLVEDDPGNARQIQELLADTGEGRFSLKEVDHLSTALRVLGRRRRRRGVARPDAAGQPGAGHVWSNP